MQYDIAIIGLGPSGAMLARLLSKNFKVAAVDKGSDNSEGFTKPCGGLLAPDAQKVLAMLDLSLPKSILADPQIFSVRTIDIKTKLIRHYRRFYINMDRFRFDCWLRSLIGQEVQVFDNTKCKNIERINGGFLITLFNGDKEVAITARQIVGADGANSIVRRTFFPDFKVCKLISIQQWFKNTHITPNYTCIFDKATTDTYAWGVTKGGYFIFGGAFEFKNARKSFEALKENVKVFGFELNNPVKTEACMLLKPTRKFCLGSNGVFLVGEAAGFISPSSFEGISYALDSARILADVLNKKINKDKNNFHKLYKKATHKMCFKILNRSIKSLFIYKPFLRKIIMKSRIKSISVHSK